MMMSSNYGSKEMILRAGTHYEFKPQITYNSNWYSDYGLNSSTGFTFSGPSSYYKNITARSDGYNFGLDTIESECGFVSVHFEVWGDHFGDSEVQVTQSIPTYSTVYFKNNTGQNTVYLYTHDKESQGSWPGAKILDNGSIVSNDDSGRHCYVEETNEANLYKIYVVGGGATKFIVNKGDNSFQTESITLED
jgi:hypothetical protein